MTRLKLSASPMMLTTRTFFPKPKLSSQLIPRLQRLLPSRRQVALSISKGVDLAIDLDGAAETKAKTGFLSVAEAKAYLLTNDINAFGDIGYRIEDTYQNINAEKGSDLLSNTKGLSQNPGDDLRAIAETIAEAVALSEPVNDAKDVVKGGVISSYSLSPDKVASSDYKDLSVREFKAVDARRTLAL